MKTYPTLARPKATLLCLLAFQFIHPSFAATQTLIGWSDLGMVRMDSDYSVFSLWPPGNTIRAQLIYGGRRLTNATGITVTYQAVADPDGSVNSTSEGKTDFWEFAGELYGTNPPINVGLEGYAMPGPANTPQPLTFDRTNAWFTAAGIPITPYNDALQQSFYPLMRLVARSNNIVLSTNHIVLAVSDEVNCRACHASGAQAPARPSAGWVWNSNADQDYRLNILRLHDQLRNPATFPGILASNGYNPGGLYRTVVADGNPVLCTRCHQSNEQPGSGFGQISQLTTAIHSRHANVIDPATGLALEGSVDRSSCYYCHPGVKTRALRGVMGDAVSPHGGRAMQCQSCHGPMSAVGAPNRAGWLDLPQCQSCHSGTATSNNGQIRYDSVFEDNGAVRQAVNSTFATTPNVPSAGHSLFRYSTNHGKLFCQGCHGSAHAEFPADRNDNIRVLQIQPHLGMLSDCTTCHNNPPSIFTGPHGLHKIGPDWVGGHIGLSDGCSACHGADERGTILSLTQADRVLTSRYGTKNLARGSRVGCYLCHRGSNSSSANPFGPAVATNVTTNTTSGAPVTMTLRATDTNSTPQTLSLRIVSQPPRGTVGLTNSSATYYPEPGFVGTESFTFLAWNGATDSNLGTGTVSVVQGPFSISARAIVPPTFQAGWPATFCVSASPSNVTSAVTYDWDFGDGSPHGSSRDALHTYNAMGTYQWSVISRVTVPAGSASTTNRGTISITGPAVVRVTMENNQVLLSWPQPTGDALLEQTSALHPAAWSVVTQPTVVSGGTVSVLLPRGSASMFYRLRKI